MMVSKQQEGRGGLWENKKSTPQSADEAEMFYVTKVVVMVLIHRG